MADASDRALAQALAADVKHRIPAWYDPRADRDLYDRVTRGYGDGSARHPDVWRWAAAVLAVCLLGTTALIHAGSRKPGRSLADAALTAQLAQDTGAILNQAVSPADVTVSLPGPNRAVLANNAPGRWRTVMFQFAAGAWTPVSLTTVVAGITLTYTIYTGAAYPSVVLPMAEMTAIERRLAQVPYSSRDTQAGALARLPINLSQAVPEPGQLGQPKVALVLGRMKILALTYDVTLPSGQVVYAPIGWYWWAGAPTIMTGQNASPPS